MIRAFRTHLHTHCIAGGFLTCAEVSFEGRHVEVDLEVARHVYKHTGYDVHGESTRDEKQNERRI